MIYLGVVLALIIMSAMIAMALSKKSNFAVRIASLGALALMVLTIIICLFLVFTDDREVVDESILIIGAPIEIQPAESSNTMVVLLLILILVVLFGIIVILSMKEHKKNPPKSPAGGASRPPISSW